MFHVFYRVLPCRQTLKHLRHVALMSRASSLLSLPTAFAFLSGSYHVVRIDGETPNRPGFLRVTFLSDDSFQDMPATALYETVPEGGHVADDDTPSEGSEESREADDSTTRKRARREVDYAALNNGLYTAGATV